MREAHSVTAEYEISNWVAWCWSGSGPGPEVFSRCGSAEGRYISSASYDDEPAGYHPPTINQEHAIKVQAVYDRMPLRTRQVLRYEYTQQSEFDQWEQGEEVGPDGQLRPAMVWVGNNRRQIAILKLKISAAEYHACVDQFISNVAAVFGCTVPDRSRQKQRLSAGLVAN